MLGSNGSLPNDQFHNQGFHGIRAKLLPLPATLTMNKRWFLQLLVLSVNMMGKDLTCSAHRILTSIQKHRAGKKSRLLEPEKITWVTFLSWTTLNLLQTGGMSVEAACKQSVQFHSSEVRTASTLLVFKKTVFSKILIHHGDSQIPQFSTRYVSFLP